MKRAVVLNVVGLTQALLGPRTPRLASLRASLRPIQATIPAVTCSAQATYLTGKLPSEHGVVANGWYFRDLGEVWLWRQSNRLIQGDKLWHLARQRDASFTCANNCWWFNMLTDVDWSVTPRPLYCADGRKLPDCYCNPPELRERLNRELGQFPLFKYWGPATSIESSAWIARASRKIEETYHPTLQLVYLPHLDYALQKLGPDGDIGGDLAQIDRLCGELIDFFGNRNCRVVVVSEYGITPVRRVVHPNRLLRAAGLLAVKVDLGREYLDVGRCRAFAVADHQIAHVYVQRSEDVPAVKELFHRVQGVEQVLDKEGKRAVGLDHPRSGEIVLLASADAWFSYYFWEHDDKAPDYARTVNIHAKPGYDPCELFVDPTLRWPRLRIAKNLVKKSLGFRYLLDLIPLDATLVKGSHGRPTDRSEDGPLLMTTDPRFVPEEPLKSTDILGVLLDHVFQD